MPDDGSSQTAADDIVNVNKKLIQKASTLENGYVCKGNVLYYLF